MKIIVIGCTHAGTQTVKNLLRLHPEAAITVYERNDNVSFLSCGIALHVGGVVDDAQKLFYSSPQELEALGAKMRVSHNVHSINRQEKTLVVENLETGEQFIDSYDKLVYTTGSTPIVPPISGVGLKNIQLCKNYAQAQEIIEKATHANKIAVVGAGYIGVELVEAFEAYGKDVTFIEGADRVLNKYLDREFTDEVEQTLTAQGIRLALNEKVEAFAGNEAGEVTAIQTSKTTHDVDLVILCVGFRPQTELLKGELDTLENGALLVNEYMQTSDPSIFAAGDNCSVFHNSAQHHAYIPLATNATKMGTLVAYNIVKPTIKYRGTQGTSGLKLYDLNMASTGLTEEGAAMYGLDVRSTTLVDHERPTFMPTATEVKLKLVYDQDTMRLIGAQVLSKIDQTQLMNTLSVCIQQRMTVEDLAFSDFFFQPHYNKPVNILNTIALKALTEQDQLQSQLT
ncbi:FAD-dependent oxidoreductase [Alkalihalobacillus sp. LMS6]|uniref:FAD-dependent oxidoreductase n=1 Tax=Alkalihalobacillus sp. LMS6 TaxID=2924034 RepID=UPI0020D09979|nr:FAD-dependent oxidoreductase [Alkalihalobacillus sp. LMS6]UTR07156.1 FAD-dependent oxidoreductase [Alkalihalobacillus sp. LMS6]